jgi:hypothetical protein
MRNSLLFGTILAALTVSLFVGSERYDSATAPPVAELRLLPDYHDQAAPAASAAVSSIFASNVPNRGSVQVLNGCGVEGAANRVADFLRSKNFDVKNIGNAPSWNYPATMIVSRTTDMALANEIEKYMKTGKTAIIRNGELLYDVTVITGHDFEEKIR